MKHETKLFFLGLLAILLLSSVIHALPVGPIINYAYNSTAITVISNRSQDAKGTITVLTLSSNQQDYKWKAYVGNVSGKLALDDANGKSIYDWSMGGGATGKVFVSRSSGINWANVSCVNQSVIDSEESALGMPSSAIDNINRTFNYTAHKSFLVGTKNITNSSCRSTATYINDARQAITESSFFQEVLLKDDVTSSLVYTTILEQSHVGFDNTNYDFQILVAENESATVPLTYYFYVELG